MRLLNVIASTNPEQGGVIEWVRQFDPTAETLGHQMRWRQWTKQRHSASPTLLPTVHALGQQLNNFYSSKLTPWLFANRNCYDIVIAHGLRRYPSYGAWRALNTTDRPYFVYIHGMLVP